MVPFPKIVVAAIAVLTGGAILSLSGPRYISSFALLPTASVMNDVRKSRPHIKEDLLSLYQSQQEALAWQPSARLYVDKALTEMAMAKWAADTPERVNWYEMAERSIEQSLLVSPSNPYAWAKLAYLRIRNGGVDGNAHEALSMSYLTGSNEKTLVLSRIRYALRLWDKLSEEDRDVVKHQILWQDRMSRSELVKVARQHRRFRAIIILAMLKDMKRFDGFMRALREQPS